MSKIDTLSFLFQLKGSTDSPSVSGAKVPHDTLLIIWDPGLKGSTAEITLSPVDLPALMAESHPGYDRSWIQVVNANTARISTGGITHLPVPRSVTDIAAALVVKPATSLRSGSYLIVCKQIDAATRRIIGAFEFRLKYDATLNPEETPPIIDRTATEYARARHQLDGLASVDPRWRPVLAAQAQALETRLTGLSIHPHSIRPALIGGQHGLGGTPPIGAIDPIHLFNRLPRWMWLLLVLLIVLIWLLTR